MNPRNRGGLGPGDSYAKPGIMAPMKRTLPTDTTASGSDVDRDGFASGLPGLMVVFSGVPGLTGAVLRLDPMVEVGRGSIFEDGRTLEDPRISTRHARFELLEGPRVRVSDLGSRNGTLIDGRRVAGPEELDLERCIELGSTFLALVDDILLCSAPEPSDAVADELIGSSSQIRRLRNEIRQVAGADFSALILGPSGAGKDLTARAIHRASGRAGKLVSLNCAVLTDELAGSELFGHVKGAFTGAQQDRPGAFRSADGGTLFLDEIAELSPTLQAKLLRALQERRVQPVGADREVPVDVRVLAATNRDLPELVRRGIFRGDLFSRITGAVLNVPALRERPADVIQLAHHFLEGAQLHPKAARALLAHDWPFNVRDLKTVVSLLEPRPGEPVKLNTLAVNKMEASTGLLDPPSRQQDEVDAQVPWPDDDVERARILERLLTQHRGNIAKVANQIDRASRSVRRWCKLYGIDVDRFR